MNSVDFCIKDGQVLDVFRREFHKDTLWIDNGEIVATGKNVDLRADEIIDAADKYIVPGFIDAHTHVESSMVTPSELGKVLLKNGVTTIVADPHEIANVAGIAGIKYMIQDARQTPLSIYYMLPSSVPCTPFDHNGATLTAKDLKPLYQYPEINGLAEVMDYPAVARKDPDMMQKIRDAKALGYHADGHCAGLTLEQLKVYQKVGINTDHESLTVKDVKNRLKTGFTVFLREGTVERDIKNTIGAVTEKNADRFAFCTDDKTIHDLIHEGSINYNIKLAIQSGIRPETAYAMASLHAARAHKLTNVGALAVGYQADLVLLSDIHSVKIVRVMKNGQWQDQTLNTKPTVPQLHTVHQHVQVSDLKLSLPNALCNVIGIQPNHITTDHLQLKVPLKNGEFVTDLNQDILKIVSVERHHNLGTVGVGLVHGFQLKSGAIAGTVAHDAHNIIAVGTNDSDILFAINAITQVQGGIAVVDNQQVKALMPLAVSGLMSTKSYQAADADLVNITKAYQSLSPNRAFDPFITLSFLALPVIPTLKITDQGLYDFDVQDFIDVAVSSESSTIK